MTLAVIMGAGSSAPQRDGAGREEDARSPQRSSTEPDAMQEESSIFDATKVRLFLPSSSPHVCHSLGRSVTGTVSDGIIGSIPRDGVYIPPAGRGARWFWCGAVWDEINFPPFSILDLHPRTHLRSCTFPACVAHRLF